MSLPLTVDPIMDAVPSIHIGNLIYPGYYLVVIGIGVLAAVGLWLVIYRTRFGVLLRATSQDRRMASALGLNVGLVYVSAFAIGCFMAGLGGAIIVPSQAAVLGMGIDALVLAFVVVVIGGLGSLQGALVGALIVSFVRTAGIQFFPEIELAVLYLIRGPGAAVQTHRAVRKRVMKADLAQISYRPKLILAVAAILVLVALALLPWCDHHSECRVSNPAAPATESGRVLGVVPDQTKQPGGDDKGCGSGEDRDARLIATIENPARNGADNKPQRERR
jgi:branched-subunit amino acid ABC-type transport system permease component